MHDISGLHAENRRRTETACQRKVPAALEAIRILEDHPPKRNQPYYLEHIGWLGVLRARVVSPRASLAEIAAALGMTKHTYSSRLRRALAYARKLNQGTAA